MKIAISIVAALLIQCGPVIARAQVPAILGTWNFNAAASHFNGPAPQSHVRSYRLTEDGVLIGLAVIVDSQGRPNFLQFAAKPDGKDYPEFDSQSASQFLSHGTMPVRTYAEIPTSDPRRVKWIDKLDGTAIASGEKWVSEDGKRLSFTQDAHNDRGEKIQYVFVFDRTGR